MEIGVFSSENAVKMIETAKKTHNSNSIEYFGLTIDIF